MKGEILAAAALALGLASFCGAAPARKSESNPNAPENAVLVEDIVYKITATKGGYRVLFRKHQGVYHLEAKSKNFRAIRDALLKSQSKHTAVKVEADAVSLKFLELAI